jgi:ABC-type amino acid transport substrate-binding protein
MEEHQRRLQIRQAVGSGDAAAVAALLAAAEARSTDAAAAAGQYALEVAAEAGNLRLLGWLMGERGLAPGRSNLGAAADRADADALRAALDRAAAAQPRGGPCGTPPVTPQERLQHALEVAASEGRVDCMRLMLQRGAAAGRRRWPPARRAAASPRSRCCFSTA